MLVTFEDCASSRRLGVMVWASKRKLWIAEWPSLWKFGSHLKTYHEWLGDVCVTLAQGEYGEDWVSWAACSATGCPGLCVLEFKYSAAPTRCTTETAVGTGLPNNCLHQAYWFYFINSFISSCLLLCACSYLCLKTLTEDFLNFLSSISSVCLSSSCVILWLRFLYSVLVFISSWWPCLCSVMFTFEYLFRCK